MSFSISILATMYRETGLIDAFSKKVSSILRNPALIIILVPAIIGLLPIAGGALMSAPIVGVVGNSLSMSADLLIFLNVWFRHVLFMIYPLGQTLIVAGITTGYDPVKLAIIQIPVAGFMILIGYLYMRRYLKKDLSSEVSTDVPLWKSGSPLFLAVGLSLLLNSLAGNYAMPIGVFIGAFALYFVANMSLGQLVNVLKNKLVISLTISAFSIMLLQHSITDTSASTQIAALIKSGSISTVLLETFVPAIVSGLTSSSVTGIVITVPILSAIKHLTIVDASIIYTSSFIAYTISPTHLCLIFTAKYFNEGLLKTYKFMLPAAILTVVFTVAYYMLFFSAFTSLP